MTGSPPTTTTAEANDENSVYLPPENPRFEVVGIEGVDEEFFDRAYQEEVDVDEEFGGF